MITNPSQETGRTGKGCSAVNMVHYWKMEIEVSSFSRGKEDGKVGGDRPV